MKIEVYLDEKTFKDFTKFDILRHRRQWKRPAIFASIFLVAAIISFIMHKVDGAVFLGIVLLCVGLGVPVVYFSTFYLSLKNHVKEQKLDPPRNVYNFGLLETEDGIHISNDKENVKYKWKQAFQAFRVEGWIYLYMTPDRAFLINDKDDHAWKLIQKKMGPGRTKDLRRKR